MDQMMISLTHMKAIKHFMLDAGTSNSSAGTLQSLKKTLRRLDKTVFKPPCLHQMTFGSQWFKPRSLMSNAYCWHLFKACSLKVKKGDAFIEKESKTSGSDKPRHPVLQMLASHKSPVLKDPKKKVTPLLMPYGRFSKVIIYYLASKNNIHRRPDSAVHHTGDDFILGNLKFVPKVKQSKPAPAPTKKPSKHKLPQKIRKGKPTFQLVDEDDEAQQESIPQEEGDDPDLDLAKKMSFWTHQRKGKGEGDDADMERAIKLSLDPAFLPQGQAPVGGLGIQYLKQLPNCLKYNTGQAFLYHPKKAHEALAGPDPEPSKNTRLYHSGKLHVSLAGPNPEHMDDEFLAR
ncbi:hypothetical protein Tco_0465036 [Tanacetum coccineum]